MFAHFTHHLLTALPIPLLPFIRNDFNLSITRSTWVSSSFALAYGIGQLPAGWMADRIGPRVLITIGILGVAVVGVLVGLSQSFVMMIVFLIFMGLAGGGYHPAATPLISMSVEPKKRGRALGFHLIGGSGSFFLAPIIAAAIASAWGWRVSFLGLAVPMAIFGVLFFIILGRQGGSDYGREAAARALGEAKPTPGYVRRLVALMILIVIGGGAGMSVMVLVPLYLVDHFHVSEQLAASMLSIEFSAGLWASPLGGYLSDRVGRIPIILITGFLGGILIYLLLMVPFGITIGSVGLGIGAILLLIGINNYSRMPVAEAYIMSQTPGHRRSLIYGIYYFAMQEAGAGLAPLMGYLADTYGYSTAFTTASITMLVTTLVCAPFLWGSKD